MRRGPSPPRRWPRHSMRGCWKSASYHDSDRDVITVKAPITKLATGETREHVAAFDDARGVAYMFSLRNYLEVK